MAASNQGGMQSREYQQGLQARSVNVDERGNFSIQVLKTCLINRYFALQQQQQQQQQHHDQLSHDEGDWLPHLNDSVLKDRLVLQDITQVTAFLLHKSDLWLAIRQVAGRFFNSNSTLERPVPISHFELGMQLSQAAQPGATGGYTVFCVAAPLQWLSPPHIGDYPPPKSHAFAFFFSRWRDVAQHGRFAPGGSTVPQQCATGLFVATATRTILQQQSEYCYDT